MKKNIAEFCHRGLTACGLGPLVLAVIYMILQRCAAVETLTVNEVCTGILSLSALAFVAGGMNIVYTIEKLPLMAAIFIHGGVLYAGYLATYLINGWLERGTAPVIIFSAIFIFSYIIIWAIIYSLTRRNTAKINEILKQQQQE